MRHPEQSSAICKTMLHYSKPDGRWKSTEHLAELQARDALDAKHVRILECSYYDSV